MKKVFILSVLLMALLPIGSVFAETVIIQNYFYAHANQAGTFYFKDKYGTDRQYGDNVQHDAVITGVVVSAQGLAAGDQIIVQTGSGQSYPVTPGQQLSLNVAKTDYIRIALVKTGTNEVFARLTDLYTFDDSDGGTNVHYIPSVNDIPTEYGDLGPGTSPGEDTAPIVNGEYYYFEPRDAYRYDYNPPSGVSYYQLHFDAANGDHYYRQFDQSPTGLHYLTCNGTYVMRFYDSTGKVIAKSNTMTTGLIQAQTCNSQPEDANGYNTIPVSTSFNGDPCYITWTDPGADFFDIYMDGEFLKGAQGVAIPGDTLSTQLPCGGQAFILVAYKNGSVIGQTDFFNGTYGGGDPGGGGGGSDPGDDCGVCDRIAQMLQCPAWDDYMGEWEDLLRDVIPPAPNWQQVANIMRDTIVPAMGQELVNRAPVIADIIADEFESREDPVIAPGSLITYDPPYQVPQMQDMTQNIDFNLNQNVPSFEPDYSGSQKFTIPDPLNIQLEDTDAGYVAPDPSPSNNPVPVYSSNDIATEPDPGYAGSAPPTNDITVPGYVVTNPDANDPGRTYTPPNTGDNGTMPSYQQPSEDSGIIPGYQLPNDEMPEYQRSGG